MSTRKFEDLARRRTGQLSGNNQEIVANKNNSTAIWKTIRHTLPNKSDQGTPYSKDTSVLANSADSSLVY